MMHIAIFLPSLDGGGAEKMMLALAESFCARGIRCDLVIAMNKGQFLDHVPAGVRLVPLGKKKTIRAAFAFAGYLRRERPDAVLATVFAANVCALLAATLSLKNVRTVICEANLSHIDIYNKNRIKHILGYATAFALYRRASQIIAISDGVRKSLLDTYFISASKIRTIYNPLIVQQRKTEEIRKKHPYLLVACGRLEKQKDYPTLLRAFARVRREIDAELWILGEGSLDSALRQQCNDLGLVDSVCFKGFVLDPAQYMQDASVFVHSACFEGFGLVLVEALASGCPIVATDCPGGVREVLAQGEYGALVPVGDDVALADAILRVLRGELTFPDASEHLRQFDLDHVADEYLRVLLPA